MKKIVLILLCIFTFFVMSGCDTGAIFPNDNKTPFIIIGENGNWYIDGVDTGVSAQGPQGEPGKNGKNGVDGAAGKDGVNGTDGESAYEVFIKYYPDYTGTEKDWITDVAMGNTCNLFGHEWDEGVVTTPAKEGIDGVKTYTCQTCNEHKYEVIPMIKVYGDAEIYEENGIKYVNYGSYPQTHVGDETLIAELNKLIETNDRGYYEYDGKEYAKVIANPRYYGTTSSTDKYGNVQYYTYTYSDGSTINTGIVEWFKVEPIKWRIISENADGSYQLYSEYILDATKYYNDTYYRNINGVDIAANNYKYSNIRAWLNGYDGTEYKVSDYTNKGFYNMAFKDNEKGAIITKEVDNSASTTFSSTNKYACENTFDKMYLLSYQDMYNGNYGFTDNESRYAQVTDYAKAVGACWNTSIEYLDNGYYWLRSPNYYNSDSASFVHSDGYVNFGVDYSNNGLRVACTINLE